MKKQSKCDIICVLVEKSSESLVLWLHGSDTKTLSIQVESSGFIFEQMVKVMDGC